MKPRTIIVCLSAFMGLQAAAWAQPFGFSVSDANKNLYRIDLSTGEAVNQGPLGYPVDDEIEGLFSIAGKLYGVGEANYGLGGLYDLSEVPGELIGNSRRLGTEAGAAWDGTRQIAWDLQADDLLPINTARSFLYRINPANGAATFIGFDEKYADGIAVDSTGRIFATDFRIDCALYRLNPANGRLTLVGSLGLAPAQCTGFDSGAAFAPGSSALWAIREDGAIYRINTTTGQATFRAVVTDGGVPVPGDLEGLDIP